MTKKDHIHKLKRVKYKSGNTVFFCALPDCNIKLNTAFALGKRSICWRCEEPFIMTEYSLKLVKPHCENCHKFKNAIVQESSSKPTITETSRALSLAERLQQATKREEEDEI